MAIKELLPDALAVRHESRTVMPKSSAARADYQWGLDRFLDEARTLALFDHRNIVRVLRFFKAHGTGYIVMEYAEGRSFADVLHERGAVKERDLQRILLPLLDGLEQVHSGGVLHRDIKPANILVRDDGSPVLVDFGSARQAVGAKSRAVTSIVTPGYAPIEQYSTTGRQGPWTDIYALGAVCYRALTGAPPADATERVRHDPLRPVKEAATRAGSKPFLAAVDWALQVDEDARPQTVAAWRAALVNDPAVHANGESSGRRQRATTQAPNLGAKPASPEKSGPSKVRLRRNWIAAACAVVVGAVAVLVSLENRRRAEYLAEVFAGPFVDIPAGEFRMGDLSGEGNSDERPVRHVNVPAFRLGKFEVTRGQFRFFADYHDGGYLTDAEAERGALRATVRRNGPECVVFDDSTNSWGYQAGFSWRDPGFEQSDHDPVVCVSWREGSILRPVPVGAYQVNEFGLHDVIGNVSELIADCFPGDYENVPSDGTPAVLANADCSLRIARGGDWTKLPADSRVSAREPVDPEYRSAALGFRVALDP